MSLNRYRIESNTTGQLIATVVEQSWMKAFQMYRSQGGRTELKGTYGVVIATRVGGLPRCEYVSEVDEA